MRQLVYVKKCHLEWRPLSLPRLLEPTDALVRPFVAARCDADLVPLFGNYSTPLRAGIALHIIDKGVTDAFGTHPYRGPFPIGHECVAEVVEIGEAVRSVAVGDHVVVPWSISCGQCETCAAGLTSKCQARAEHPAQGYGFGPAMGEWGGMICDLLRVPYADNMLIHVPRGVDPIDVASASDNLPDAWRTVGPFLARNPGAPVLIAGGSARSIGLYSAGIAVACGSARVDYVDDDRARLEIAQRLGANPIESSQSSAWYKRRLPPLRGGYPITVDASANPARLDFALRSLSPGGNCTSVGYYFFAGTKLPLWQMYVNCSSLHTGLSHPHVDAQKVLDLVQRGRFQPGIVNTLVADWDDAPEALLARTTKVVLARSPTLRRQRESPGSSSRRDFFQIPDQSQ